MMRSLRGISVVATACTLLAVDALWELGFDDRQDLDHIKIPRGILGILVLLVMHPRKRTGDWL